MEKIKYSKWKSCKKFKKGDKIPDSGLIIIFGDRGSGKSAYIAKQWYEFQRDHSRKNGFYNQYSEFYTNVALFDNIGEPNILDLTNYKLSDYLDPNDPLIAKYKLSTYNSVNPPKFFIKRNSVIALDELGIIAHSRDYKNFPKEFISFMKLLRKLGIYFIANSQNYDIDKTIRESASELRIIRKFINLAYLRKINKWIDINRGNDSQAETQIIDKIDFAPITQKNAFKLCYIPFYSDLYDTYL